MNPPFLPAVPVSHHPRKSSSHRGSPFHPACEPIAAIDEAGALELVRHPGWCAQEELDGTRLRLRGAGGVITATDRLGRPVVIPSRLILSGLVLGLDFLLDGELVEGTFHAFDLLELAGADLRPLPLHQRLDRLSDRLHGRDRWAIHQVPTARLAWEKETLFEVLRGERRKGIVFKPLGEPCRDGVGKTGHRSRKLTFRPSQTCRVSGYAGSRFILLGGLEGEQNGKLSRGMVRIPEGQPMPPVGTLVEVAYLEVSASGGLEATALVRRRNDCDS